MNRRASGTTKSILPARAAVEDTADNSTVSTSQPSGTSWSPRRATANLGRRATAAIRLRSAHDRHRVPRPRAGLTMDGVHDLGGVAGFGTVDAPPSEPAFAEEWERRAFRVSMATIGGLGVAGGRFRHSIERM